MLKKTLIGAALFIFLINDLSSFAIEKVSFKVGGSERVRHEYCQNPFDTNDDYDDNMNYFRIKTSLWGQMSMDEMFILYAKLTNENRAYTYRAQSNGKKHYAYNLNEVIFDNLYIELKKIPYIPLDFKIGRQDLSDYGEQFIFADGTPLDGSRTYYFNVAKATLNINPENSIDIGYIYDTDYDKFLPIMNEVKSSQVLNATDETAVFVYQKSDSVENLHLENYYVFKKEDSGGPKLSAKKTILNTLGTFSRYKINTWTLHGQIASQFGYYGDKTREGLGGYAFIDKSFPSIFSKPVLSGGFVYLSGDDRGTSENEAWDPLFSRFPWYSDAISYLYNTESGMCYWTNLQMWRVTLTAEPVDKIKFFTSYNYLRANQTQADSAAFSSNGKTRGHMPQFRIDYQITKNISTYFLSEIFFPGDYYKKGADPTIFLRTEILIKF